MLGNRFEFNGVQMREMPVPKPISDERRAENFRWKSWRWFVRGTYSRRGGVRERILIGLGHQNCGWAVWLKFLLRGEEPLHCGAFRRSIIHLRSTYFICNWAYPRHSASLDPTGLNLGRWLEDFPNEAFSVRHHLPLSCPTSSPETKCFPSPAVPTRLPLST